jgi:pimeloyl-ACP methyl ester carboxylesterase
MAQDTIAFLEGVVGQPANLVGCSAGANVALLVALRRPELARRLVLISGVFHRDGWVPDAIDPDASAPEVLARGYAQLSPDGPDHSCPVFAVRSPSAAGSRHSVGRK